MAELQEATGQPLEGIPSADTLTGAEWLYLVQSGNSRKADLNALAAFIEAQGLSEINLPAGGTATPTSTDHVFQIGPDSGINTRMSPARIQGVNNGVASTLNLNRSGGSILAEADIFADSDSIPHLTLRQTGVATLTALRAKLAITGHAEAGYATGAEFGMLSNANNHAHVRASEAGAGVYLQPEGGAYSFRFLPGYADFVDAQLNNVGDPTAGNHVGDRDFNDARYMDVLHFSTMLQSPIQNKSYWLSRQLPKNFNITQVTTYTAAGTCNVNIYAGSNSTGVLGAGGAGVEQVHAITSGTVTANAAQALRIVCTAVSGVEDLTVDIQGNFAI